MKYFRALEMKKKSFTIFVLIFFTMNFGLSQEVNHNFSLGLTSSVHQIYSKKLENSPVFINLGITSEYQINKNYTLQIGINHSKRCFDVDKKEIETFFTERYGIQAFYSGSTTEKLIEIENLIRYKILNDKKVSPFVGIGYKFHFTYSLNGSREIEHQDDVLDILNMKDQLGYPGELSTYTNFGLTTNIGSYLKLSDRLKIKFSTGLSFYFQSNLAIYGYPNKSEKDNRHNELDMNLSLTYGLK
jgi:hypothetical protein